MRVTTRAVYDIETGVLLESEWCDYFGPVELAGRSESKQISQQSEANSAQNQGNAQTALAATNDSLKKYSTNLDNFMSFGRKTYGSDGEFMKDQNTIANTTAKAGTTNLAGDLAVNKLRTGENSASYAPTVASSINQSEQALTDKLATADASRLDKLTMLNQFGVQASALPASVQSGLYGTSLGGSNAAMGTAASAAQASPGFFDVFGQDLAQGAGAALGSFAGTKAAGCWIAAAVFDGWDDPRTSLVRSWLHEEFANKPIGGMVVGLYMQFGERVANVLHQFPLLKTPFRWLFNRALIKAKLWAKA